MTRGVSQTPLSPLSYLAALVASPWITFFVRLHGRAFLGGDTVPSFDPALTLSWTRELWGNHVLLGGGTSLMLGGAFPHLAFLAALQSCGLAPADAAKFELAACWSLATLGAYAFSRSCGLTGWPAALAVTPYACGPIAYMLYSTPTIAGVGAYATAPFAAAAVVEGARSLKKAFALSLCAALLFGLTSQNPAFSAVPLLVGGLLFAGLVSADRSYRAKWFAALLPLLTIVACNLWWMVPEFVAFYHDSSQLLANRFNADYIRESVARQRRDNSLYYMLRLAPGEFFRDGFYNGPFGMMLDVADVLARYVSFTPISILLLVPVALFSALIASLARARSWSPMQVVMSLLFVLGLIMCTGHAFPGILLFLVVDHLPAHELFREPYTKFGVLMSLALVPIVGWSLIRFGAAGWVRLAFAAYCAALLAPLLVGRGGAVDYAGNPLLGVTIPPYVPAMRRHLIERGATDLNTRILQLPMSANSSLEARTWGYFGPGFYRTVFPGGTIESYGSGSTDPASDETIRRLVDFAQAGNSDAFSGLAAWAGITHVLWDGASVPTFGGQTVSQAWPAFASLRGLELEYVAGPLRLYRLSSPSPLFSVSSELVVSDEPAMTPPLTVAVSPADSTSLGSDISPNTAETVRHGVTSGTGPVGDWRGFQPLGPQASRLRALVSPGLALAVVNESGAPVGIRLRYEQGAAERLVLPARSQRLLKPAGRLLAVETDMPAKLAQRSIRLIRSADSAVAARRAVCSAQTAGLVMTNAHLDVDVSATCDTFIALRTAYSDEWFAESSAPGEAEGRTLKHFRAFGFANGWALPAGQWHVSARFGLDGLVGRWRVLGALATLAVLLLWMLALGMSAGLSRANVRMAKEAV